MCNWCKQKSHSCYSAWPLSQLSAFTTGAFLFVELTHFLLLRSHNHSPRYHDPKFPPIFSSIPHQISLCRSGYTFPIALVVLLFKMCTHILWEGTCILKMYNDKITRAKSEMKYDSTRTATWKNITEEFLKQFNISHSNNSSPQAVANTSHPALLYKLECLLICQSTNTGLAACFRS